MRIIVIMALAAILTATSAPPVETYVDAPGPDGPLKGTMLSPSGTEAPVILMIPGSGPTDRDGNNSHGLKAATLKLLAEGLASEGIASVRIDKRGMYGSAAAVPNASAVTIEDYATDVHSWVDSIRHQTRAKCVWVLGHSEGGLVALEAGQKGDGICGLILVSTAGRPIGAVLRQQLQSNPANAPILDQAFSAISDLENGRHVDATKLNPVLLPLFRPQVQNFLINEMKLEPTKLIASYHGPVLIVQGQRDLQIDVEDAKALKKANTKAALELIPDANHVLKTVVSSERGANVAAYSDPSLPLAPKIVTSIAAFIKSKPAL